MDRFWPVITASIPPEWFGKESITLIEPGGQANVIASSEPLSPEVQLDGYAEQTGRMLDELPAYKMLASEPKQVFGGRDGHFLRFEWTPEDGEPVTQIQILCVVAGRGYTADELRRALGHRGFDVELLCAPGAAATVAGDPDGGLNPELDRSPGLLDAAARLLAIGRRHHDAQGRSAAFFDTLPRKVVAAAALCRDEGRLLVVHDSFKRHWTIPGGVVDPGEDPRSGAQREAFEEAGVEVGVGAVLGVFASSWPERVVLVYDARPLRRSVAAPKAVHAHEIDAVEWLAFDEALARLAPYVAEQVRRCLAEPGGTHWQDHA